MSELIGCTCRSNHSREFHSRQSWPYQRTLCRTLRADHSRSSRTVGQMPGVPGICESAVYRLKVVNLTSTGQKWCLPMVFMSGERPPWTQRNCSFIKAARGSASKAFIHASYTLWLYLVRHSVLKVKYSVKWRHSWFPRNKCKFWLCIF